MKLENIVQKTGVVNISIRSYCYQYYIHRVF